LFCEKTCRKYILKLELNKHLSFFNCKQIIMIIIRANIRESQVRKIARPEHEIHTQTQKSSNQNTLFIRHNILIGCFYSKSLILVLENFMNVSPVDRSIIYISVRISRLNLASLDFNKHWLNGRGLMARQHNFFEQTNMPMQVHKCSSFILTWKWKSTFQITQWLRQSDFC
jgi:hypothetical protein